MEKIFFFIFISPTEIIWHIRLRCIIQGQWAGNQSHNHREWQMDRFDKIRAKM
jgi:hypothetical protein